LLGSGKLRKPGAVLAATAVLVGTGGALVMSTGAAFAATPTVSNLTLSPTGVGTTSVSQGTTTPLAADETFTVQDLSVGDTIAIDVAPPGLANNGINQAADVYFGPIPSVYEAAPPAGLTGPQFTESLGQNSADAPGTPGAVTDELDLTVTAAAAGGSAAAGTTFTVYVGTTPSGVTGALNTGSVVASTAISLTAGTQAPLGTPAFTGAYEPVAGTGAALTVAPPATIGTGNLTANNPATSIPSSGATAYPISNVVYTEPAAGTIHGIPTTGNTVSLTVNGGIFNFAGSKPVVTVSSGDGVGIGNATVSSTGVVTFPVYSPSVSPAVYTISGLALTGGTSPAGPITATLTQANGTSPLGTVTIGGVGNITTEIGGIDSDSTAAASFNTIFPHTGPGTCPTGGAAVIATDGNFPDALAASSLASYLDTGILLTQSASLSGVTALELQNEGISTVYIVGGPAAVSTAVQSSIASLPVYSCGGTSLSATNKGTINVVRIGGVDQFQTASLIAQYPQPFNTPSFDLTTAFEHANNYNDTTGMSSPAGPGISARTAIVASGVNYPDAMAASALAYADNIPVLLTTPSTLSSTTAQTLTNLGIQQVILLGGPAAVSDTVEGAISGATSAGGLGIPVLRVAGQDATDTAQKLAQLETNNFAFLNHPLGGQFSGSVFIARGDFYADGLTSSVVTGNLDVPLLLTLTSSSLGTYLPTYLNTSGSLGATQATQFGGPVAITPATLAAANAAIAAR
jgi:putative cell wall-binding protein